MGNHNAGLLSKLLSPFTGRSQVVKDIESRPGVKWVVETTGRINNSAPTIVDGTVYVGTWGKYLYAIDAESGTVQWTDNNEIVSTGPIVIGDTVYYVIVDDSQLHALDAETGNTKWTYKSDKADNKLTVTEPSGFGETVYVGTGELGGANLTGQEVHAVNADTGNREWKTEVYEPVATAPTATAESVFVLADDVLLALDPETGTRHWTYNMPGESNNADPAPVVGNGFVYACTDSDGLCAVDAETGELVWETTSEDLMEHTNRCRIRSTPTVAGDTLYVGVSDFVMALDAHTGEHKWKFKTGSYVSNAPTVADGVVFVPSWDESIRGIDVETGDLLWEFEAPAKVSASPIVSDGVLYMASEGPGADHGYVYAVEPDVIESGVSSEDTCALYGTSGHHDRRIRELREGDTTTDSTSVDKQDE